MNPQPSAVHDLKARLLARAASDPVYRRHLLTDARAAIEQETGVGLAPEVVIQVVEETPTLLCVVLPAEQPPQALPDADLSGVAGGTRQVLASARPSYVLSPETGLVTFFDGEQGERPPAAAPILASRRTSRD